MNVNLLNFMISKNPRKGLLKIRENPKINLPKLQSSAIENQLIILYVNVRIVENCLVI